MSISSVIYSTWAQTNSQIIFLFLSLNEKETKILDVVRIRCAGTVCVTQCGLALSAPKAWGGGTHLTQWIMTLQNNWCLTTLCGDEDMMGFITGWASRTKSPGMGDACALGTTFQMCHATLIPQLYCHCCLGIPQNQLWLGIGTCSAPTKCKEKHNTLDHSKKLCTKTQILLLCVWALRIKVVRWAGFMHSFFWVDSPFIFRYM